MEKESLWAKVLTNKYIRREVHLTKLIKKPHASNAWRGIDTSDPLLLKGVGIRIQKGHNTLFWRESWSVDTPLIQLALQDIPLHISYLRIKDYWIKER